MRALPVLALLALAARLAAGVHWGILGAADEGLRQLKPLVEAAQLPLAPAPTPTVSPTITPTHSITPTFSITATYSITRTFSATPTGTSTPTLSPSFSASPSFSPSPSFSATRTPSPTPSATRSGTSTATVSPTPTVTRTRTPTPFYSPTASPTAPPTLELWRECASAGTWFGSGISSLGMFNASLSGCTAWGCPAMANPLTGSASVNAVQASGGGGTACAAAGPWVYGFGVYGTFGSGNASAYRARGHLRFDLRLASQAPSSLSVSIGSFLSGTNPSVALNPGDYSSAAFTAVEVPISAFSPDPTASMNMPFMLHAGFSSPPAAGQTLFYVDHVRWTGD